MVVGNILMIIAQVIYYVFSTLINLLIWFLTSVLPTLITFIGLPMFFIGIIMAIGLTGGSVLFFIVTSVGLYYFVKKAVFESSPQLVFNNKNNNNSSSSNKIKM
jgi:hypothetical protein